MKNFKILLTLTMVLLAMLPLASAVTDIRFTGGTSTNNNIIMGTIVKPIVDITDLTVGLFDSTDASASCFIYDVTGDLIGNKVHIGNVTVTSTGNNRSCVFSSDVVLLQDNYYFVGTGRPATLAGHWKQAVATSEVVGTNLIFNKSSYFRYDGNSTIAFYEDAYWDIRSITSSITGFRFQGQTPANNSLIYYPNTTIVLNTTTNSASVANITHYLYNSSFGLIGQNNGTNEANYTSNFTGLSVGLYYFNATANNGTSMEFTEIRQVNVTNYNSIVNITAINAITGAAVTTFEGFVYQAETGFNKSYTTSSGQALVESRFGNVTIYINAVGYAYMSSGVNLTVAQYNKIFAIHQTNTLNITFYNQATPTTVLTGPTISLDLISDLYANNYTTTNGTLYITLLTPEDYNLRYYSTGYTTRFYTVTVTNRSYQSISLYLINNTVSTNLTISVIDEITDPVNDAQVQVLKYNLPTNTYVLQEIVTTGNDGTAIATVTLNNEYYKFIVVYEGEVKLTTTPEYITSTSKTLQISTGSSFGAGFFEYYNFYKDLSFNNNTNNFRLDYVDGDGVNSQVCMRVSRESNFSSTVLDTTCQTGASGTILISVSAVNGTTYNAYAYFLDSNGVEYYLDSESYTYPSGSNVFGSYGLFLQLILTVSFALVGLVGMEYIPISTSISLYLGQYLGLNQFSTNGLNALFVASILLFLIIIMNKRRL